MREYTFKNSEVLAGFYVLFNSISVISGQCVGDNERLCTIKPCLLLKDAHLKRG